MTEVPDDAMYFHAKWNREPITTKGKDYTLIDGIKGTGYYVGTYFALCALERYWGILPSILLESKGYLQFFLVQSILRRLIIMGAE
ncbi:hypothetical protein EfmAA242_03310 [Enterococcus faecium]|nr:hypothetical protein EfmAA242_03310 [Enterococcus faecium]